MEAETCPVTLEEFTSSGDSQPVFLPGCGHTFSRGAVKNIIQAASRRDSRLADQRSSRSRAIRCPLCSAPQPLTLRTDNLVPNWDTIRRVEQLKALEAAAAEKEAAAVAEDAVNASSNLGDTGSNLPIDTIQKILHPPATLQNSELQALCFNAALAQPGSTLDMQGKHLSLSTASSWFTRFLLSNETQLDACIHPELTLLDATTDEWAWDLAVPIGKVHLWNLRADDVSICNAHIKLPSDGILLLQAESKITFYNVTLEGGSYVCGDGSKVFFESVQLMGGTITATAGSEIVISRCTLSDCPLAVLAHGSKSHATIRRTTAHRCAVFAVATSGASVSASETTLEHCLTGNPTIDVRGPGSCFQASDCNMSSPGDLAPPTRQNPCTGENMLGCAVRARGGATVEMTSCLIKGFLGGLSLCGAGTVGELSACRLLSIAHSVLKVQQGAAAEIAACNISMGSSQAIFVEGMGSSVRASRCAISGTSKDAICAVDGGGVRLTTCSVSGATAGWGVAVAGAGSRLRCQDCTLDGNARGAVSVTGSAAAILRACGLSGSRGGYGVSISGADSRADLEECVLEKNGGDGLYAGAGSTLSGTSCTVRLSGRHGVHVCGAGAQIQLQDSYVGASAAENINVVQGAHAVVGASEVGPGGAEVGVRVHGEGSLVNLTGTNVGAAEGAVVLCLGATGTVKGCTLEGGVRVGDEGSQLQVQNSDVQGVSVQRGHAMLQAQHTSFMVRPQQIDAQPGTNLSLEGCTWQVDSLTTDELCMYVRAAEWQGPTPASSRAHDALPTAVPRISGSHSAQGVPMLSALLTSSTTPPNVASSNTQDHRRGQHTGHDGPLAAAQWVQGLAHDSHGDTYAHSTEGSGSMSALGSISSTVGTTLVPLDQLASENMRQALSADAAQAETTLSPQIAVRLASRYYQRYYAQDREVVPVEHTNIPSSSRAPLQRRREARIQVRQSVPVSAAQSPTSTLNVDAVPLSPRVFPPSSPSDAVDNTAQVSAAIQWLRRTSLGSPPEQDIGEPTGNAAEQPASNQPVAGMGTPQHAARTGHRMPSFRISSLLPTGNNGNTTRAQRGNSNREGRRVSTSHAVSQAQGPRSVEPEFSVSSSLEQAGDGQDSGNVGDGQDDAGPSRGRGFLRALTRYRRRRPGAST